MRAPLVTVVIPTARRPESLARALSSVAAQQRAPAYDVVVVDNAGDARVDEVVKRCRVDVAVRVVREDEPGASAARNRGVAEATAGAVAFLDDDVVADPGWLAAVAAPVLDGAEGAGGPVRLDPTVAIPRWADGLRRYLSEHDLGPQPRPLARGEYLLTANAAFRVEALLSVGGLNPRLGPQPRSLAFNDDVDLCRRLQASGARLVWVPGARVCHEVPRDRLRPSYLLRRQYAQGRSDFLLEEEPRPVSFALRRFASTAAPSLRRGPWRPGVAFAVAGEAVRAAGFVAEAARARAGRR